MKRRRKTWKTSQATEEIGQPDLALTAARTGQRALPASAELRDRVLALEKR